MADPLSRRDVREEILRDLHPVRPLRSPWKRVVMFFGPWVAVVLGFLVFATGVRPDLGEIGALWSWGASGLFLAAAFLLAASAVRESIPGAGLPTLYTLGFLPLIICAQLAAAAVLHSHHPFPVAEGDGARLSVVCSVWICVIALTGIAILGYLITRGLPTRRARIVLLASGAAVAAAEALWRIHCPYTSAVHLVTAHVPPYVVIFLGGLLLTWLVKTRVLFGGR